MTDTNLTDERLNLFIDEQLDIDEMDEIRKFLLDDTDLRERVCQLKAVRELVSYAYESAPYDEDGSASVTSWSRSLFRGIAASVIMVLGIATGWALHDQARNSAQITSSAEVFQFFKDSGPSDHRERKIILHVTTGDIYAINNALNEAEQLLASYRQAGTPMKLDIITYKEGINMLRVGVSPYVGRIEELLGSNENVNVYACRRSISKAKAREGKDIDMMPRAITAETGHDLITERLEKGWIYIKV